MSEELRNYPMYASGYNDALEWAANWLVNYTNGHSHETIQYAKDNAESFRAAKLPIQQQNFFVAVRNDPYMTPEQKAYWLAMEPKGGEG